MVHATIQGSGSTPAITEMRVIPVAGHDSMLLNLCGAHAPYFIRTVVVLKDSAGRTGLGEVPGGAGITKALEKAIPLVVGTEIGRFNRTLNTVRAAISGKGRNEYNSMGDVLQHIG